MASDYPPFQRLVWNPRDFAAFEETFLVIVWVSTTPLEAGSSIMIGTYTVPAGKKLYFTEWYTSQDFDGVLWYNVPGLGVTERIFFSRKKPFAVSWTVPGIWPPGTYAEVYMENQDVVAGHWGLGWSGYLLPASKPEEPKSDDPEENFKLSNFNYLTSFVKEDGEQAMFFTNTKQKKQWYLRAKYLGKGEFKVLNKAKGKLGEFNEILSTIRSKPEKVVELLKGFEEKYGKKKAR
jgi:hypothetical protein